jgi:hypothetical protein
MSRRMCPRAATHLLRLAAAVLSVIGIAACSAVPSPSSTASLVPSGLSTPTLVALASPGVCPVTIGQPGTTPPPSVVPNPSTLPVPWVDTWYGNEAIWIRLPPGGVLPAMPDPGETTISTKFPWWRVLPGQLTASGVALDGDGQFSADVRTPSEYGPTGFVPSGLTFDHPGCWRITGSLQGQTLSFVINVVVQSPSLFLLLKPASAPSGTEVDGRTAGSGAFTAGVEPLRAFLLAGTADAVTSPDDARLVEIGRLVVDAAGDGRISFRVPELEPSSYGVMVFCPSCAPTNAGRAMLWVANFEVTSASP